MGGNGMNHMMETSDISWAFTNIVLGICFLLVLHITLTLWQKHRYLRQLKKQHSTLNHSIPMSLGMISTMTICIIVGCLMKSHLGIAYVVGFIIAVLVSGVISCPFKDEIAVLDGVISGTMGGLMGIMVGAMIPQVGFYILGILLTVLFAVTWFVICRRINVNFVKANPQQSENNLITTEKSY